MVLFPALLLPCLVFYTFCCSFNVSLSSSIRSVKYLRQKQRQAGHPLTVVSKHTQSSTSAAEETQKLGGVFTAKTLDGNQNEFMKTRT